MLKKDNLFVNSRYYSFDEVDEDYFALSFPNMPDKTQLENHLEPISYFSDDAMCHYMPFMIECLEEDPFGYDILFNILKVALKHLDRAHDPRLPSWKQRLAAIGEVQFAPRKKAVDRSE